MLKNSLERQAHECDAKLVSIMDMGRLVRVKGGVGRPNAQCYRRSAHMHMYYVKFQQIDGKLAENMCDNSRWGNTCIRREVALPSHRSAMR
jgi:hypothetical protein